MLIAFLRERWRCAAAFALFSLIFAAMLALYRVPPEPALYAAGLCAALGMLLLLLRFLSWRRRVLALRDVASQPLHRLEQLTPPATLCEAELQQTAQKLHSALSETAASSAARQRELTQWMSLWVHQVKTPVSVMRLRLQQQDSEENRALLGELFRVEEYVDMALCYVRLGSETTDWVFERCDLDALIRASVREYAPQFVRLRLFLHYQPVSFSVLTDRRWLGFVLGQLLSNALKYTPSGGVTITLKDGVLCLADTGIGIAPEDLPRVFEQGYTGLNGRSQGKSTGLGLYLCKTICDRLGHRLWLTSTPGEGTCAFLDLNRRELAQE